MHKNPFCQKTSNVKQSFNTDFIFFNNKKNIKRYVHKKFK